MPATSAAVLTKACQRRLLARGRPSGPPLRSVAAHESQQSDANTQASDHSENQGTSTVGRRLIDADGCTDDNGAEESGKAACGGGHERHRMAAGPGAFDMVKDGRRRWWWWYVVDEPVYAYVPDGTDADAHGLGLATLLAEENTAMLHRR